MKDTFIIADNIISPLGRDTAENFSRLKKGNTGIKEHFSPAIADQSFYAALLDHNSDRDGIGKRASGP